jgi:hypothetical protein
MRRGTTLKRSSTASPKLGDKPQVNLADKLIETIRNLSSNRDLLNTRISLLNGEGLKTASIMEIAGMYRSLVSQVAVMYDTDDFQNIVAPFIEKRFVEMGSPSLTPGTLGSYIFGCYINDYGMDSLNKFCTPICAASIRVPNRNKMVMRCSEKVIWTDGGDTPVFILIDEDPSNSTHGKVFIPWVGTKESFRGLTQGAIDEIRSFGVEHVEIYGQLFNNKYILLMETALLTSVPVVERIRIRFVDYVNSKNGGVSLDKCPKTELSEGNSPVSADKVKAERNNTEEKVEKKNAAATLLVILLVFFALLLIGMVFVFKTNSSESNKSSGAQKEAVIRNTLRKTQESETVSETQ